MDGAKAEFQLNHPSLPSSISFQGPPLTHENAPVLSMGGPASPLT